MLRSIWDELEDMNRRIDETFGMFPTLPVRRFLLPTWPVATEKLFTPTTDVYYRVERLYGTFERHFPIPKTIDQHAVTATYAEGVLEIVLTGAVLVAEAKKQEAKAIPVEVKKPELAAKA